MTILHALVLGLIEGITEFLPVSSTAHLILTSNLLGLTQTPFQQTFEVVIQLGAISSVVVIYVVNRSLINPAVLLRVIAGFIPTGIIGLLVHKFLSQLFASTSIILWALLIGGLFLITFEQFHKAKASAVEDIAKMPLSTAFFIGVFQALAIIPGVSRSAATIIGGLMLNVSRPAIVLYSFLLAVPTMIAASGLDLLKTSASFSGNEWMLLGIGFITSFAVAFFAVKWFVRFIGSHSFAAFGIYRVLLALCFFALIGRIGVH